MVAKRRRASPSSSSASPPRRRIASASVTTRDVEHMNRLYETPSLSLSPFQKSLSYGYAASPQQNPIYASAGSSCTSCGKDRVAVARKRQREASPVAESQSPRKRVKAETAAAAGKRRRSARLAANKRVRY